MNAKNTVENISAYEKIGMRRPFKFTYTNLFKGGLRKVSEVTAVKVAPLVMSNRGGLSFQAYISENSIKTSYINKGEVVSRESWYAALGEECPKENEVNPLLHFRIDKCSDIKAC